MLFKCVVENDLTGVKTYVEAGEDVNAANEEVFACLYTVYLFGYNDLRAGAVQCSNFPVIGVHDIVDVVFIHCFLHMQGMTALHFAADRGFEEILEFLLQNGANVNAVDASGQTALMYAASCEHKVISILFPPYFVVAMLPSRTSYFLVWMM